MRGCCELLSADDKINFGLLLPPCLNNCIFILVELSNALQLFSVSVE